MHKTHLLLLFSILTISYSCKKSDTAAPLSKDEPTYNVRFNVQNFETSYSNIQPSNKSTSGFGIDSSLNYVKYLNYIVYDSLGNMVNKTLQINSGSQTFGTISDKLKAGQYTFVIAAGTRDSGFINLSNKLSDLKIYNALYGYTQDIFLYKTTARVGNADTTFNNITLNRITGALEIRFTDTIPSSYQYMTIKMVNVATYYNVATNTLAGADSTTEWNLAPFNIKPLSAFALGSNNKLKITISGMKTYGNIDRQITIDSVSVYTNKKTILTGKFFNSQNIGIPVTVNPAYSDTIRVNF